MTKLNRSRLFLWTLFLFSFAAFLFTFPNIFSESVMAARRFRILAFLEVCGLVTLGLSLWVLSLNIYVTEHASVGLPSSHIIWNLLDRLDIDVNRIKSCSGQLVLGVLVFIVLAIAVAVFNFFIALGYGFWVGWEQAFTVFPFGVFGGLICAVALGGGIYHMHEKNPRFRRILLYTYGVLATCLAILYPSYMYSVENNVHYLLAILALTGIIIGSAFVLALCLVIIVGLLMLVYKLCKNTRVEILYLYLRGKLCLDIYRVNK